jgi:hypothetical protein
MDQDEYDDLIRRMARVMERMDGLIDEQRLINGRLETRIEQHDEVHADLKTMLANQEGRLQYAEETLRLTHTTQQAIKDILERLNGR